MMFEHTIRFPNKRASFVRAALCGVYCNRDNRRYCLFKVKLGLSEREDTGSRDMSSNNNAK